MVFFSFKQLSVEVLLKEHKIFVDFVSFGIWQRGFKHKHCRSLPMLGVKHCNVLVCKELSRKMFKATRDSMVLSLLSLKACFSLTIDGGKKLICWN